jgi:hypothetical protein
LSFKSNDVGATANAHGAACETVTVRPAIVIVPVRATFVFAATAKVTVPVPFPVEPLVTVSHVAPLTDVQAHPAGAVTDTVTALAPAAAAA